MQGAMLSSTCTSLIPAAVTIGMPASYAAFIAISKGSMVPVNKDMFITDPFQPKIGCNRP
jgi:hypothetical protein